MNIKSDNTIMNVYFLQKKEKKTTLNSSDINRRQMNCQTQYIPTNLLDKWNNIQCQDFTGLCENFNIFRCVVVNFVDIDFH